ncbi:MAG: MMPL family transporter [Lachnospiraceae bacterium]|nr:MMPL family transporter [uncultured Acetatifactor sp.]MCI8543905.1 MMPL family transporter [Lachnospiraceae bacterium]
MEKEKKDDSFMMKLATLIVDKRKGFYLVFILLIVYSVLSMNKVKVNNDLTSYLPDSTETRQGLDLMGEQFITYGTARIMVCNITFEEAERLAEDIREMDGVSMLDFEDSEAYYHDMDALFKVTFDGEAGDQAAQEYLNGVLEALDGYDVYYSSDIGQEERDAADLNHDMVVILLLAGVVIVAVLLFTSTTYAEIPVFLMTFIVAAILNKGTNYWFGTISFVTDSIAVVLQLALAVDYAIILCHRFMEEHEDKDAREAVIVALSKAIPEISSSSLTTVSGMVAMMFMQFRIGYDMGIVLAKAILLSLFSVFFLMPGLLLTFAGAIDRSHHKSFVPKITAVGQFCVHTRFIVPPLLVAAVITGAILSGRAQYVYDVNTLKSKTMSENKFSVEMVNQNFGTVNQLAVIVPDGDYEKEGQVLRELERLPEVNSCMGLANIEAMDGYVLTRLLSPREFAELIDMDIEVADLLYSAYAVDDSNYGALLGGLNEYKVPLIDMFLFIYDQKERGNITLEEDLEETMADAYSQISIAKDQLLGEDCSRFVLELSVPLEGDETYAALDRIRGVVAKYYDYDDIYLVGNSTSNRDLSDSFSMDNNTVTILTALFVMVILLFTFQSAGLPVLLVVTIQGSTWLNFSMPYLTGDVVYFLGYLVVSAIQMGATIDYAIVITSRYMDLKTYMPIKKAIVETLNQAFPTIVTSGSMLVAAGFIISNVSTNAVVAAIGLALGRGTLTSIGLVLLALPQTLLIGDIIIEKTAFTLRRETVKPLPAGGRIRMSGHIKGYVNGVIEGEFTGLIDGEMGAVVRARDTVEQMRQNVPVQEAPPRLEAADEAEGGDIRIVSCGNGKGQEAADDSSGMPEDGRAHASWNRTESDKETESARVQKGEEEEAANHDER